MEKMNDNICNRCKAKNSIITDYESGEMVCNQCGLVYEERIIDDEYEKRTFQDESGDNQIQRVGPPSNPVYDNECGTNLIIRENGKTKVIKTYSKSSKIQKNFYRIQHFLSQAQVSQVLIEETKEIYGKISKDKNMQGRRINDIIIGIYYYVCRKNDTAKTIKEISNMFNITERKIKKAINSIKYDIEEEPKTENQLNSIEKNYIQTFLEGDINRYNLKMLTYEIIDKFNKSDILEGKSPKTIAGLSLYLSCKLLNDNLYENNNFFSMFSCRNTLKKAYDEIKGYLNLVVPKKYADKMNVFL
jgi:transcription initiation factor TFIIB